MIALRQIAVMPGMMLHFDISRDISVSAVEQAIQTDEFLFLIMQKEEETQQPEQKDLYEVGCIVSVKQMIRMPDNVLRVMISGIKRGVLKEIVQTEPYLQAAVEDKDDYSMEGITKTEEEAMLRALKDMMMVYESVIGKSQNSSFERIQETETIDKLVQEVINNISVTPLQRQSILEEVELLSRFTALSVLLAHEIEICRIKNEFQAKVKEQVDKNQKEYLLREQLKVIHDELGEGDTESDMDVFLNKLETLSAEAEIKEKIKKQITRFKNTASNSSESGVIRGYIETLLSMPWNKAGMDNPDVRHASKILDEDHYGLKKVKERILEFLAVRTLNGAGESPIICLVGPPGTGKTSIAKSVARALDKKYVRICLGGVRDEAEIRGHRRTYVGAMPGRIAVGLKNAGVRNPLMLLDEIDKVSSDHKGDTSSALLEVLDPEQNKCFSDHYIELPIDLSEVLFLATANTTQSIPRPLLDRMEVIEVNSYTENEKFHIAKEHLIPKVLRRNGLDKKQLTISAASLEKIINSYTREAGVRNLERRLGEIARKAAREILEENKNAVRLTEKNLKQYLGKETYTPKLANKEDEIGIVRGLAWTSVGGDTLEIEVNVLSGKGELLLTGQLGDVMKESARTGISYIRSVSDSYFIAKDFFEKHDIHIHIPEGAVPKDGPSAGITMVAAMLSAITGKKVRKEIAMTGEVTLRGRVLPIGGLKEKIIAAKIANIKQVLVPEQNEKDILELEDEILEDITITYVKQMQEVIRYAFVKEK